MKKAISVVLVMVLLLSSICTGVWAVDTSTPTGENLMKDYTYQNWKVTNRATINAPTDSFSGDTSNAFSVTKLMWRSAYTKIALEAGETYELRFYYKEDAPSKVYLTDSDNRGVLMAPTSAMTFGDEVTLTNKDYSNNLLNDLNYNIPSDKQGWNIVTAVISPSVTGEHTFCFTGAGPDVNDLSLIHFSDFSLVKQGEDPNVLANTKASDWFSGWNGNTGESVSGAIAVKTAWRSGYTKVTLKPNTEYDFNFNASTVKISDVRVYPASEITSKAQLTCPSGGGNLPGGTTNLASGAFSSTAPAQNFATATADVVNTYYTVSESFTTTNETEYYIVLDCTQFLNNGSVNIYCTFVHLKDLSLVAKGDGADEEPNQDPNVLNDTVMAGLTWNAIWTTGLRNPKDATLDKSHSYSGNTYAMTFGRNSRYRDNYAVVTLEPNTTYNFSFRYKSGTSDERIEKIGFVDASKVNMATYKGDFVKSHLTDATTPLLGESEANIERELGGVWNLVSTTFTTGTATEYIMYIYVGEVVADQSFTTMTLSDFSLVAQENEADVPEDPNVLNDEVMAGLTWNALWNTGLRDPKMTELDKSQSYSGTSYVMTFGRNSRYRDNYTVVTLEPNTTYNFSFRYKSGDSDELIHGIGFVDASKVNMATYKGDYVKSHLTDATTPLLGESEANVERELGGVWNLATTTFTTGTATEYIMYIYVGEVVADQSFTTMTLSDFSLVAQENEDDDVPEDTNVLNDEVMKNLTWSALWAATPTSAKRDPKTAEPPKSQSYSGSSYAMTWGGASRYRDNYTTVTLEPNTTYSFSFRYKSGTAQERVDGIGFVDASKVNLSTVKTDRVSDHRTDASTPILGKTEAVIGNITNGSWNEVTTTFTTGDATEYIMYLAVTFNGTTFSSLTLSDFSLVASEEGPSVAPSTVVEQLLNVENWNSTWNLSNPNVVSFTKSTDSYEGGEAIAVSKSNYRSTFVKLSLAANTKYKLTFNYKGKSAVSNLHLLALNDIDSAKYAAKPEQLINALKDGVGAVFTQSYSTLNYDGNTWNEISASFKTNDNTEYYLVFENNTGGSGFVASDFAVEIDTTPDEDDEENKPDPDNLLVNTKPSDWTSSWGYRKGVAQGNGISLGVAWRSGYTKVTLRPNVAYKFQFDFENVKVTDIRVYDASEITDLDTQMLSAEGGGAVKGGKNNLAPDAVTSTCIMPVAGETYTASEIFTTSSATEYYIIFDAADFVISSILLKNISLKKYFDPATDVYGTVKATNGGSATNLGKNPYEKGKETTITATPNEGNNFEGWFDVAGNKLSSDKAYTFTVDKEFEILAKFSGTNMPYIDWMAENGMDGTFENGSMPGWYAMFKNDGTISTWATFVPHTYVAHNGKKSMRIWARHQHSYFNFTNLAKNSDYYLSFYIYCADKDVYNAETNTGFRLNEISLSIGGDTYWGKYNEFSEGGGGWHRVELFFNTGNFENAELCINYMGDVHIDEKSIYLDDVTFVQYLADGLDNGDFESGKAHWMGKYTTSDNNGNTVANIVNGEKLYQPIDVDAHSLYTVSFRAKGDLVAAASKINKYSTSVLDIISSETRVTTSGDWNEYSFELYTGPNDALNLVFEAISDGVQLDDIKLTKHKDSTGGVVEKIDFETDRFAIKHSNTDVYEIFDGGEGSEFVRSGSKSLHFKYGDADKATEYLFEESYLDFQISNTRTYKLTFYYKTAKGNTIKISPDFLGQYAGQISIEQKAANDGWNMINFYVSSGSAHYFKPLIANIIGKTTSDFYIDDITYTIISAVVLETDVKGVYAEPPVALLYNEGFEEPITAKNWGKLPSTMKVIEGDTKFGEKYIRANGKTFYILPVSVEAGALYYFSASLRGTGGYIGLSTTDDGKGLFNGVTDKVESFLEPTSEKWQRSGIKFSAPISGTVYLVIDVPKGYLEADNILIYKEQYALEEIPNGHDIIKPYDYKATSGKNYIVNGGYNADGSVAEDGSPSTGDTFPAVTIVLITLTAAVTMLLSGRKNKKEAE